MLIKRTLRLTPEQDERVTRIAQDTGTDYTEVLRRVVSTGLAPYETKHEQILDEFHNLKARVSDLEDLIYLATSTVCSLGASLISKQDGETDQGVIARRLEYLSQLMSTAVGYADELKKNPSIGTPARRP